MSTAILDMPRLDIPPGRVDFPLCLPSISVSFSFFSFFGSQRRILEHGAWTAETDKTRHDTFDWAWACMHCLRRHGGMGLLFDIFVLQLMQPAGWPAGLMSFAWLLVGWTELGMAQKKWDSSIGDQELRQKRVMTYLQKRAVAYSLE
ncbi:hypothetical protein VTJ04DRAFT_9487 [Mycothermus thermophilus]|uniref:uncharacterized protein n=1 Tax=Humicola insolens TaxID=85995 RepID=UPI003743F1B5